MRTRLIVPVLTAALGLSASAVGCQIIAGLTTLDVTGGTGGAGGGDGGTECTPGKQCGGNCVNDMPVPFATCTDAGTCPAQGTPCDMPNSFCAPGPSPSEPSNCIPCGMTPPGTATCTGACPSCDDAGTCVTTCDSKCNGPDGGLTLHADMGPARLMCNGDCNGITVDCHGPFACDVFCGTMGCHGLTLNCSNEEGPCSINCVSMSCAASVVNCKHNTCTTTCADPSPLTKHCTSACCANTQCKLSM